MRALGRPSGAPTASIRDDQAVVISLADTRAPARPPAQTRAPAEPARHPRRDLARPARLSRRAAGASFAAAGLRHRAARHRAGVRDSGDRPHGDPGPGRAGRGACAPSRRAWSSPASGWCCSCFAFRALSPGGGVFATSSAGSALLNLTWHLALPSGALAATSGRPRSARRRVGLAVGIAILLVFATAVPDSWVVVKADGSYYGRLRAGAGGCDRSSRSGWSSAGSGATGCAPPPPAAGSRSRWCCRSTTWC